MDDMTGSTIRGCPRDAHTDFITVAIVDIITREHSRVVCRRGSYDQLPISRLKDNSGLLLFHLSREWGGTEG